MPLAKHIAEAGVGVDLYCLLPKCNNEDRKINSKDFLSCRKKITPKTKNQSTGHDQG